MRALLALVGVIAIAIVAAMSFGLINVTQTREAKMPDMALVGGQAPAFKADVANVSVGTENKTVEVPTIAVKQATIAVPTVKVEKPEGNQSTGDTKPASQTN